MAEQQIEDLQLNRRQVETAVDFYESYASFILDRLADAEGDDAQAYDVRVDAASSLRAAGQWALLLDPLRAVNLLRNSALLWQQLGYGYGSFLLAAFSPRELDLLGMRSELAQLARPYDTDPAQPDEENALPEPMLHPQQQAYLLLAATGISQQSDLPTRMLGRYLDGSPHRRGTAPVGSLGTPLRVYWDIAINFLRREDEQTAALVARDLVGLGSAYAEAIDSAMANERLWFNAAAPVDVGDADIAAIAMLAARRLGSELTITHLRSAAEGLGRVARVPLELAIQVIQGGGEYDTEV